MYRHMNECKYPHTLKVTSYNNSRITMMITTMMSKRATITPTTGPTALLLLLLSALDCLDDLTTIQWAQVVPIVINFNHSYLALFQWLKKFHSKRQQVHNHDWINCNIPVRYCRLKTHEKILNICYKLFGYEKHNHSDQLYYHQLPEHISFCNLLYTDWHWSQQQCKKTWRYLWCG